MNKNKFKPKFARAINHYGLDCINIHYTHKESFNETSNYSSRAGQGRRRFLIHQIDQHLLLCARSKRMTVDPLSDPGAGSDNDLVHDSAQPHVARVFQPVSRT